MIYVVWIAAFFFAGSWTFGLLTSPNMRLKSTIVTVVYWWLLIGLALTGIYSAWHLLWLMPLALALPMLLMHMEIASSLRTSTASIFFKAAFIIGPAIGALVYWS